MISEHSYARVLMRRGGRIESEHLAKVVVTKDEEIVWSCGRPEEMIFPRSLIKPIHAVGLISSGAADAFSLSSIQIALAASSHGGRDLHIAALQDWCRKIWVEQSQLQCGTHRPFEYDVADGLSKSGTALTSLHNNNSGKHLSILTICRHFGFDLDDYGVYSHPVQIFLRELSKEFIDWNYRPGNSVRDACGPTTEAIPIGVLAIAYARLFSGKNVTREKHDAASRIIDSMAAHPDYTGDLRRLSTKITHVTRGRIIVKGGSEGGFGLIIPSSEISVIVKVNDGAQRAADHVLLEVLYGFGEISKGEFLELLKYFPRDLLGYDKQKTGDVFVEMGTHASILPDGSLRDPGFVMA